ncbi:TPA: MucBP domain-containing protein [Streptococcus suis]|nr:MucBP domain-containing protein [Streptococcus suis]
MRKSRKNRFDWYSVSQRFSIRKYHIGAVSVLLGSCLLLNGIQAAAETQVAENTQPQVELVTEASPGGEVKAARQVTFTYKVVFVDSNGVTIKEDTLTHSISTTEEKATYSHTLSNFLLPEGYSLASNQDNKLTVTLLEGEVPTVYLNLDVLQVVEEEVVEEKPVVPPAEEAGTKEEQATEKVEEPTLETAEEVNPEEKVVAEVPQAPASETVRAAVVPTEPTNPVAQPIVPTSLEEAKHVLEQVTSEAEVLSSQAERLVATSDQENEALKTVSAATKLTATDATITLNDSKATPEIVNAKIDAVRTNVEALVLELRKFLGTDVIEIALAATTDMNDGTNRPGYWTEEEEVLNKDEAATTSTISPQKQEIPSGYEVDPTDGRVTFLIYSLSSDEDSGTAPNTNEGSYNLRYGTDYYITLSLDRVRTTGNIYARLVSKTTGFIEEVEIAENGPNVYFNTILNGPKHNGTFTFRMAYAINGSTAPGSTYTGEINIASGVGGSGNAQVVYSLLTNDRSSYTSYTGTVPVYLPVQETGYYVKATDIRPEEFLASYSHVSAISGDVFTIASPAVFANYELIESPELSTAPVAPNFKSGTTLLRFFPSRLTAKTQYLTKDDGTSRFINFLLNPDHPDFLENYAKYRAMESSVDFQPNGFEDLDMATRLPIIEKYLADIAAVQADTSLTEDVRNAQLTQLRANYATEINSDANKFLLTFVSEETAPLQFNPGNDAITGSSEWIHTFKKYYRDGANSDTFKAYLTNLTTAPYGNWRPDKAIDIYYKDGTGRVQVDVPYAAGIKKENINMFSSMLAMFNSNMVNMNSQNYYYAEKGGVKVYYIDTAGTELKDPQFVFEHADTNTAYDTKSKLVDKIEKAGTDGTTSVYYYKEIDTAALKPASQNTDAEKRSIVKITDEVGIVERDALKELTYVYELAGSVNVNYVDVNGNKLSGTDGAGKVVAEKVADTVNAKTGTEYNTIIDNRPAKIITADGKTYELAPAADYTVGTVEADHHLSVSNVTEVTGVHEATGSVASGITKEITFVYKEVTGKVIVNFKSIDGEELQGPRTDTEEGSTGRDYNTEGEGEVPPTITKEGKTYKLVPNLKNGNPTGKVTPGTTEVTYYYQLVTGDVVVNYENTDGKVIAPQVVDVNDGNIGDAYDTSDEGDKPEKIVEDGTGDVYYIKPAGTEVKVGDGLSGETGQIVEGTTQVTYIYEKAGNVKINYILDDAAGTPLQGSVMDEVNAKPGTSYDTTDEGDKPETISKDGKVYRLKEVKADSAAENGDTAKIVAGETLEVTYVYTEVKSDVVVEYYDTEGNLLTGKTNTGGNVDQRVTDTSQASVGTPYNTDEDHRPATITTADETIYHYVELKEGSAQPEGTVAETTTTVQYVYAKAGSVVIRYVKEDDNGIQSELQSNVLDEDNVKPGTPYDTTDEGNKPTTITTEDGKTYTFVRKEGHDETGDVAAGETKEITYVYKEVTGKVIVNFKSIDGEELQGPRTDTEEGSTGRDYNTEGEGEVPPTITKEGKTYKLVPNLKDGNPTGKVTPGTTEVTYYYQLVTGDVVVNYENTDGKVIAPQVVDVNDGNIGENYTTTDYKPEKIVEDGTGDVYYIKPTGTEVKTGDGLSSETGQIVEGTTQVTYIYEKAGNVKINYILDDAAGTPLQDSVMDEVNAKPGTAYNTTDEGDKPETISKDGNLYRLKEVKADSAAENGDTAKIVAGETLEVTYVYTKVTGSVVINYVAEVPAEDGTVTRVTIKTSVTDEDQVTLGKPYDTTDEGDKPTTITTEDGKTYELVRHEGDETGTVVEGETKEVTYVYKEVTGKVVVNFKSTDGEPLQDPRTDTEEGSTGRDYNTEEDGEVPPTITKDGKLYRLVPNVKDGNPTGKVTPGTTEVTYYYEPVLGDVIIKYTDTEGNTLKDTVIDEDDVIVGTDFDTTNEGDKPEIITNSNGKYVLVPSLTTATDPTGTDTTETGKVLEGTTTITYVYQKVANWIPLIPNVPENERPKTEYPFDPTDPDKEIPSIPTNPTTDQPVIPHVPGYTPVDPKDNTPLTPVDPEDPSKGYVPPTPETPGEDTLIPYVPVKGDVVINYVDTDGNILKSPVTDEDDVLAGTKYDTTDEGDKPTEIVRNGDKYVLVPSKTTAVDPAGKSVEETGNVVEGTTTITYVYQKVANWIPLIPNVPENERPKTEYPFDPTEPDKEIPSIPTNPTIDQPVIPHVPGYTPVDPKDNTPLTPVDPEDPSKGYVPPTPETPGEDTLIPYVPVKGDVVIKYVDTDGNTLKDSVTDEDDVLAGTKYNTTDEGDKPTEIVRNGDKYVLVPSKTTAVDPTGKSVEETGNVVEGTTTITYVYQKVANWIPLIPNVPENKRPKTEYPFDPTEPDKEIPSIPTNPTTDKPVIPHVPGYTPVDPKDNTPLTPVDPEDPSKGYIPPTPETPGEDTLIPYVPVKGDVVINYVDTDGNILKSPVTDEDDVLASTKYDTTDEGDKPTEIVRNGDKYVLVPSKTTAVDPAGKSVEETGSVVEGTTTITYVYQKVANWIPLIPNVPENERPKTEYPFDPTEPDKEIPSIPTNPTTDQPVIPHVPGYTPVDPKDNTPLTPVDPEDPSKGYVPPTPETPGEDTLIPYVPIKNGTVIVTYITEDGEEIKSPVTDTPSSPEGTPYDTTDNKPTTITYKGEEYELVRVDGTENGTVVEGDTKVTYVYRKKPTTPPVTPEVKQGSVIVAYITEDGVEIKAPVTDTPTSPEGTPYDTTDNKPKTITYNGEEYELVRVYGTENGTVVEGDTKVTYVYRKKPTTPPVTPEVKQGTVVVTYITEDGVEIKSPVTDTPTSPEGTPYDTTDNKPKTITYNGEEYELVRVDGTENGTVVEGDTKVTYVYRKKPTTPPVTPEVKQGSVIVAYITEDGVEIKSPVTDTPTSPEGTPYDTTDNKPKTITYNGEEYELVRVEGTENGTVVEGDTKVTYVYRKVVKPTPPAPAKPSVAKPVKSEKPKLPDTGEEESTAGMLGILLLVSSLFGVRKRRRDQQ